VAKVVQADGMARSSVNSAWAPLAERGHVRLVEPGTVAVRL
jgi:hypothetical protein